MNIFSLDIMKDTKLIGKTFSLSGVEANKILKGKFVHIDKEGYYIFKITSPSEWEEFMTRDPNNGEIT